MAYAFCYRSGQIEIGTKVPDGALPLMRGRRAHVEQRVSARARHAYDGTTMLVPGLPEAQSEDEAYDAFVRFRSFLNMNHREVA